MTTTTFLRSAFEVELVADQLDCGTVTLDGVTSAVVRRPDGTRVVYTFDPKRIPTQRGRAES